MGGWRNGFSHLQASRHHKERCHREAAQDGAAREQAEEVGHFPSKPSEHSQKNTEGDSSEVFMGQVKDQVEIARYPVEILDDKRRLVHVETLTDEEFKQFFDFLKRFPQKFEWDDTLEGWVSTD